MRQIIIFFLIFFSFESISQPIYTKDMAFLGYRDDLLSDCLGTGNENYLYVNNRIINKHFFCRCIIDELIPKIRFEVLNEALENDKFDELFLQKKYFKVIDPCMKHYADIENAYSFDEIKTSESEKQIYLKMCIESFNNDSVSMDFVLPETIIDYCECTISTMINNGYSFAQIMKMEEEDSEAFNEILVPCFTEILGYLYIGVERSGYEPGDIQGDQTVSYVKLIDYMGSGYKVKISIGGITKYFFFDTGATYLFIDRKIEQELRFSGSLTDDDYKGKQEIQLANNELVAAEIILLNNVIIGDFTINNVTAAIIEEGSLLCGNSLLNKFKKWEFDVVKKQLILYK